MRITQDEDGSGHTRTPTAVTYSFILDTQAPTVTPTVAKNGHTTAGGVDYLSTGDTLTVTFTFNEDMSATVLAGSFINNGTDIPSSGGSHHTVTPARTDAHHADPHPHRQGRRPDVAANALEYHLTNGTSLTDLAGNALVAQDETAIANTVIDTTAPTLSFVNPVSDPADDDVASDTIHITADEAGITGYGFSTDNVCDNALTDTNTPISGSPLTHTQRITVTTNNGKYVCYSAEDTAGNIAYLASTDALNIDTTETISDNAELSAINLSTGTLTSALVSGTHDYTAFVANATTTVTVTADPDNDEALVTSITADTDSTVENGEVDLDVGSNIITISVIAQDGTTTQDYTVTVYRYGTDTVPDSFSFTARTGVDRSTAITSAIITPTGFNAPAQFSVTGGTLIVNEVNKGAGGNPTDTVRPNDKIQLELTTSSSWSTVKTATLTLGGVSRTFSTTTRAVSTNANLSDLTITPVSSSFSFSPSTETYTTTVATGVSQVTLWYAAADSNASVAITPIDANDNAAGHQVNLVVGTTTITITVTAEDSTVKTYTINLTEAASVSRLPTAVTLTADTDSIAPYTTIHRTRDTTPTISFSIPINTYNTRITAEYRQGTTGSFTTASVAGTGTARTITLPTLNTDDTYQVKITYNEHQHNKTPITLTYSFTLDTQAPLAPTAIVLESPSSTPNIDDTPSFTVTAPDGALVRLFADDSSCAPAARTGTLTRTVPIDGSDGDTGTVIIATGVLSAGAHTIYAGSSDLAGNTSCYSTGAAYTVTSPDATLASAATLTEGTLHSAQVTVTLLNSRTYAGSIDHTHFTVNPTGFSGLSVSSAVRTSSTVATLTLSFDQLANDFDADGLFTIAVAEAALSAPPGITTNSIAVTANTLDPPSILSDVAAEAGDTQATISWTEAPAGESPTGYKYQKKADGGAYGAWTAISNDDITTSTTTKSYTVTGLTNSTLYSFRVRAVNATGDGTVSAEVSATPTVPEYGITAPAADIATAETTGATLAVTITGTHATATGGDILCTITPDTAGGRNGTEHADFLDSSSSPFADNPTATATFAAGDTSADCSFTLNNDTDFEPSEYFTVTISTPQSGGITGATYDSANTARDFSVALSDITVGVESASISVNEDDGTAFVCAAIITPISSVSLPAGVSIAVTASTADGTATAGSDYTALSGAAVETLTDGTRRGCVQVTITDDSDHEGSENFTVTISASATAGQVTLSPASSTVTINVSDDGESAFTVDLTSDTGSNTTDDRTNDTTPVFTVTNAGSYGGFTGSEVRMYYKAAVCGTLPTDTAIADLTGWTIYKTTPVYNSGTSTTSTTGITSTTALTGTGSHCFLAFYSLDGTAISTASYGQLEIVIDTTAPTITITDPATGAAQSKTVSATDDETAASSWRSKLIDGADSCDSAEMASGTSAYTEGDDITINAESSSGKKYCFSSVDLTGNTAYAASSAIAGIDTTAPVLAAFKIGTGNGATYKVTATDATAVTGRTKDDVAVADCTASTTTDTADGWSDYTPGADTGAANDGNGRCVIITDAAGNKAAQHLLDSASIDAIPATPTGLAGTWAATSATLHWSDPSDTAITDYEYRHCDNTGANCTAWTAVSGSDTTVSHEFTGLTANTEYTLNIRALNANGSSVAASTAGTTGTAHDSDHDGLIDIDTIQKLNAVRWDLDGDGTPVTGQGTNYTAAFPTAATNLGCPKGVCIGYELTADLDLDDNDPADRTDDTYHNSGAGWAPIGADSTNNRFTATFNGNGFVIDNLFINRSSTTVQALFASTETGANITGVGLRDVSVIGSNGSAALVGASQAGTVIKTSFSTGTVAGTWGAGGLVGYNAGAVEASYSSVAVSGTTSIGGLVGNSQNSTASIRNSYAYGAVTGTTNIGGLVGHNHSSATIANSYWDTTITAGTGTGTAGATGKTTAELQSPTGYTSTAGNSGTAIYTLWDDRDIDNADGDNTLNTGTDSPWNFGSGSHYPALTFGGHRAATQWPSAGNLSDLTTSTGTLVPDFDDYQYTYAVEVPATTASLMVTPTVDTVGTTITVDGAVVASGNASAAITLTAGEVTDISVAVAPHSGATNTYTISVTRLKDYDDDDDGLIDITTHQQLNAVRWDLNGDGTPIAGQENSYATAFPHTVAGMGCKLTDHDTNDQTADVPTCTGYELRADIDLDTDGDNDGTYTGSAASPTADTGDAYYNSGSGWVPIGTPTASFNATFNGNGHIIANLFINRGSTNNVGLFGHIGLPSNDHTRIEAVGLRDALVIGGDKTGALVGESEKPVTASWTTGAVRGGTQVGGLIGLSESDVTASYSLATVNATNKGGGLIGEQDGGTVTATHAGGEVTVTGADKGGLVATATNTPTDTDNYYNSDTTGLGTTALGTVQTDTALRTPAAYTGIYQNWNVDIDNADGDNNLTTGGDDPWHITAGHYPVLDYGTGADTAEQLGEQIPAAPAGITAAPGNTEVTVSWTNPNNNNIDKYQYKQKVGSADYDASWTDIPSSGASTISHTFESLTNSTPYQYKIRAVNTAGSSIEAETAAATPLADISAAPASVTLAQEAGGIAPYTASGTHRTRDTTPTISFTAVANATTTVKYRQGDSGVFLTGVTHTGTGPTTTRTAVLPALSTNGTYQVEVTQDEDGIGNTKTVKAVTYRFILDTQAPTVTPTVVKNGAVTSGGTDYLSVGDTITVTFTFDEDITAAQTIAGKFVNDGVDIPSSVSAYHTVATARTSATVQTLTLTVRDAGPDVASGDLAYHLTNGGSLTDLAGNAFVAQTATDIASTVIDTTKPVLSPVKVGTGATATYKVTATDASPPLTGRTKDETASGSCTDTTDTTGGSWSDYTPGDDTGAAHDDDGRCVIITDIAGNSKAQHLDDDNGDIPPDFTLDITGDGAVGVYDAIAHYIYEVFKAQAPNGRQAMTPFLTGGDSAQIVWNRLQASSDTRDFSGNGSTDQIDAIIHYIYEVFKDQEPNGRQAMVPFLTGVGARTGTAVFTLLNNFAGR